MPSNLFTNKTSKHHYELFEGYSDELLTFASAACILFIIVGVPGNLLTIIALSRGKQTRNSTAIFIINLSSSDLLFGCFNLPLAASTYLQRSWSHGDLLCTLFPFLRYGLCAVSIFTVSLITINRYIIIAHPRRYPRIYQRRYLAMMVVGTWITPFSFLIPTWRGMWGRFGLDTTIGSCSILHDNNDRSPKEFLFVVAFMLPCVCIVFCYARIFYLVRKAAIRTREPKNISIQQETVQQQEAKFISNVKGANQKPNLSTEPQSAQQVTSRPFSILNEDIEFIDMDDSNDFSTPISYNIRKMDTKANTAISAITQNRYDSKTNNTTKDTGIKNSNEKPTRSNPIKTSVKTSFTRFSPRKTHYISMGNTSNASAIYPGKMSQKDRRLLKMILVIFVSFVMCYLPITLTKIWKSITDIHWVSISAYLLIYLTTCINPLIYVLMSSEYRQAYLNLLCCQRDQKKTDYNRTPKT